MSVWVLIAAVVAGWMAVGYGLYRYLSSDLKRNGGE